MSKEFFLLRHAFEASEPLDSWVTSAKNMTQNLPKAMKNKHSVERCISPPFFFHPPFLIPPHFFRNMLPCNPPPLPPPSWHSSRENIRFYDDTLESGRLKTTRTMIRLVDDRWYTTIFFFEHFLNISLNLFS